MAVQEKEKGKIKTKLKIINSLFTGIVVSVIFLLIVMLRSSKFNMLGVFVLATMVILFFIEGYIAFKLKEQCKSVKYGFATIGIVFNVAVFFSMVVYFVAPTQLFYPNFNREDYQELKTYKDVEEIGIKTDMGEISGWFYHNAEGKAPLVIYYAGNGDNSSSHILKDIKDDRFKYFEGYNFAMIDYPGYGKSEGKPSEASFKQFGLDVFDELSNRNDVDKEHVVVLGYSIGTGVANYVASERDVAGLMLMAPYADGYDLFNNVINVFKGPVRALVAYKMEAIKFAENISVKPLILATTMDEMVPYDSSVRLSKVYPAGCDFKVINGITHGGFWNNKVALEEISKHLQEVLK